MAVVGIDARVVRSGQDELVFWSTSLVISRGNKKRVRFNEVRFFFAFDNSAKLWCLLSVGWKFRSVKL